MANYRINHFSDSSEDNSTIVLQSRVQTILRCQYKEQNSDSTVTVQNKKSTKHLSELSTTLTGHVSKISSSDFYNYYSNNFSKYYNFADSLRSNFTKPPLPICVRYQSKRCVIIERPPFKVPVRLNYRNSRSSFRSRKSAEKPYECEIWIPWTLLVLVANNGFNDSLKNNQYKTYLFFRDSPLTSLNDQITTAYTPNIYGDGSMCLGQSSDNFYSLLNTDKIDPSNISEIYNHIITDYFSGGWNLDLGINSIFPFVEKIFTPKVIKDAVKKAQENNNKYIISLFKREGNNFVSIRYFNTANKMRFIYNYLSMLNLDETFEFLQQLNNIHQQDEYFDRSLILHNFLQNADPTYCVNAALGIETDIDSAQDSFLSTEDHCSREIMRRSVSNTSNLYSVALYSWNIKFFYDVDDFLNYASEMILSNTLRYLWDYSEHDRECFYKKNIKYFIAQGDSSLQYLFQDYFRQLHEKHYELIFNLVKNSILELSSYYRHEGSKAENYKKILEIDFSKNGVVLEKSILEKKESVVL